MTEFCTQVHGRKEYQITVKTDNKEHYLRIQQAARECVDNATTIDAEPVVRCEDCECGYNWMNDGTRKIGKCAFLIGDNQYVSADGFCNLGERKGGDE